MPFRLPLAKAHTFSRSTAREYKRTCNLKNDGHGEVLSSRNERWGTIFRGPHERKVWSGFHGNVQIKRKVAQWFQCKEELFQCPALSNDRVFLNAVIKQVEK